MRLRIPGNGQCSQPSSLHLLALPLAALSWRQVSAFAACAEPLLHRVGFVGSAWEPGGSFQTGACKKTSPSWMPGAPDLAPRSLVVLSFLFVKGGNCLAASSWPETPQPRTAYPDQQSHCRLLLPRVPFTTPPSPPAVKAGLAGCPGACSSAPRGSMAWLSDHHNVQRLPQQGGVEAGEMLARGPMRRSQNYLDWVHSRGLE